MITLALALALALPASAKKAPEFKVAKVLNAPVSEVKSLASLKGKVVFLEFWATWCAPCVAGVPRTNRLIESLKGEPVVFLSVTDEPADMIAAFLKTHEFKAWVGIDEAKSSFKAYKNKSRPDGWLIGKDGTLLGRIFPDSLKESDIRDAIAGRFTPSEEPAEREATAPASAAFLEVSVSSAAGEMGASVGGDEISVVNLPFKMAVGWIWEYKDDLVLADDPPVEAFNARLKTSFGNAERDRDLLKRAVLAAFSLTAEPETKETDVFLLSLSTQAGAPRPRPGDPAQKSGIMASGPGRLLGKATMARFAERIAASLPVIDDTGLAGEFALDLEWKRGSSSARDEALASAGLRLVPGRRKIEFLRVTRAK